MRVRKREKEFEVNAGASGKGSEEGRLLSALQLKKALRKGETIGMAIVQPMEEAKEGVPKEWSKKDPDFDSKKGDDIGKTFVEALEVVTKLLEEYVDVFHPKLLEGLPLKREVDHKIKLIPEAVPPANRMYKMSYTKLDELKKQLAELVEVGAIEPSKSPYEASVLMEVFRCVWTTAG